MEGGKRRRRRDGGGRVTYYEWACSNFLTLRRLDQLTDDVAAASSTSHRKRLEKERDTLRKQYTELQAFDEQLRHYADQRIRLDLDDGVRLNYGKFGDLLAEVKAVTGGSMEES